MRMKLLLAASAAALLAACSPEAPAPTVAAAPAKAALGEFGIDLTTADTAVKPGDDFFKYANGAWLATYKLPEDKARFGSFDVLGEKSENDVKSIIDGFPTTAHPMGVLSALTSALIAFNPKAVNPEHPDELYEAVCKLMGKFLVIATWTYRKSLGYPLNYYDNTKGYVENFMRLMFEIPTEPYKMDKKIVDALDKLFIYN